MLNENDEYKGLRLYLIQFHRTELDVSHDLYNLPEHEKSKLDDIFFKSILYYEDTFREFNCLALTTEYDMNKFTDYLYSNIIPYICKDMTNNVITNNIDIEAYLIKNIRNNFDFSEFISIIESWIKSNLELDMVLDMINEKGIDSLRKIDYEFLKSF